jgi:hypothetical protein
MTITSSFHTRATVLLSLLLCLVPIARARAQENAPAAHDRAAKWQEDLDSLVKELPSKHKNAFFKCPEATWRARAADIRERIPQLSDIQLYTELRRLVALLGDGHTTIASTKESTLPPQRAYPMAVIWLSDGVFAAIIPKEHEALLAQKLVRIGDTPLDAAIAKVNELRGCDNDSARKHFAPQDLRDPDALHALAIIPDPEHAPFTFADASGKETTVTLSPVPYGSDISSIVVQRPDPKSLPAWRTQPRFPYGFQYLDDSATFYIWYDTCSNHPDKPVADFIAETITALDARISESPQKIDRVVVDLRRNGGGNSALFMPMIEQLSKREFLTRPAHLFCLIGRRTFSSGMMNAYQLRNAVNECRLLGEPTGGSPNAYGEVKTFTLPNSKLTVQYSTKLFRGSQQDTDAVYPDLQVVPWSKAYFEGQDVVLERAIKWKNR